MLKFWMQKGSGKMDITKFDKNFAAAAVEKDGKRRFDLPCAPFKLYGGMYEEGAGFVRMPDRKSVGRERVC